MDLIEIYNITVELNLAYQFTSEPLEIYVYSSVGASDHYSGILRILCVNVDAYFNVVGYV